MFVNWDETLERMIGVFRATYALCSSAVLDAYVRELRAEVSALATSVMPMSYTVVYVGEMPR